MRPGVALRVDLRWRLMLADLYEIAGQPDAAKAIALGVSRVAGAMGYTNLVRRTEEHLAGTTLLNRLDHDLERGGPGEDDIDLAGLTDQMMGRMAEAQAEALRLPPERTENLVKDLAAHRAIAGNRLAWCRHIALLQNLGHEGLRQPSIGTSRSTSASAPCTDIDRPRVAPTGSGLSRHSRPDSAMAAAIDPQGAQGLDERPVN